MKKVLVLLLSAFALAFAQDMMMSHAEVRYAHLAGTGMYEGVAGTAVIVSWDSGEHEVFVRLHGLAATSGVYANHLHFNAAGDANCAAQNGDQIIGLANLEPDENGVAMAYTMLPAEVVYPEGIVYVNIHNNAPEPVGESISCGEVQASEAM
jgi:superoxide dismutase, Cu-Zn family